VDEVKSSFMIFHLVLFDKIIKSKTPFVHRVLQKLNFAKNYYFLYVLDLSSNEIKI
jgi:hypothetical protein